MQRVFRTRAEDSLPIKVEHQRIYILPTKRGWAFLLVLGYALSFLLTGLFAATLLHTYQNLANLELHAIQSDHCFLGEPLNFQLRLKNERAQPRHGIRISARITDEPKSKPQQIATMVALAAQSTEKTVLSVPSLKRGYQALGRLTLESDWPLGLWNTWSYVHTPVHGLVFPKAEAEPPPLPHAISSEEGQAAKTGQQGDVAGSSAHLDLSGTRLLDTESQLSRLVGWILVAEESKTAYSFELPGTTLAMDQGASHQLAALTACALHANKPTSTS